MFPRYGDTRGMDHMRLHPARPQPARQPEAVPTSFEGQCNPRDLAAGLDRLVTPAVQHAKQPFGTRLQLLAWLALNAGKHTGNQPTRLAHLDDGNDCAILVQGDEGPAQVVWLGHRGTPSVDAATMVTSPRRLPHSISRSRRDGELSWHDVSLDMTTVDTSAADPEIRWHGPFGRVSLRQYSCASSAFEAAGRQPA